MIAAITSLGCFVAIMAAGCWLERHYLDAELTKIKRDIADLKAAQPPPAAKNPTIDDLYPMKDLRCSEPNTA